MIDYAVIIQARMGSTRRPGKINYPLLGEPMLSYQINRLKAGGSSILLLLQLSLTLMR